MKVMMRFFCLLAATTFLSAADVKEFHKTVPLDPAGHFSLDTYKGSIRITAWDQPQAEIQARIVADPSGWFTHLSVDDVEIRVDNSPEDNLAGRDRQLEAAVDELLKQLGGPKRNIASKEQQ